MPQLRKVLQGAGTTFSHWYVNTPVCCPSRSETLSGRYHHNLRNNRYETKPNGGRCGGDEAALGRRGALRADASCKRVNKCCAARTERCGTLSRCRAATTRSLECTTRLRSRCRRPRPRREGGLASAACPRQPRHRRRPPVHQACNRKPRSPNSSRRRVAAAQRLASSGIRSSGKAAARGASRASKGEG